MAALTVEGFFIFYKDWHVNLFSNIVFPTNCCSNNDLGLR